MNPAPPGSERRPRRFSRPVSAILCLAGSLGIAVWGTWPLAAHLSSHVYDPGPHHAFLAVFIRPDIYLTTWILAWDVHALVTAPLKLFDANVFHPAPMSLASSEHMLGAMPLYAPLAMLSGDPVFSHQAMLLLTFACAFLCTVWLVHDWTGSWPAAILAGSLFAFSPLRADNLGGVQLLGSYYLPLIPLFARRSVYQPEGRWPVFLGLVLTLQALHSYYLAYAAFAGVCALGSTVIALDRTARQRWLRLALPVAAAAVIVTLVSIPYLMTSQSGPLHSLTHTVRWLKGWSAKPGDLGVTNITVGLAALALVFWRRGLRGDVGGVWPVALVVVAMLTHLLSLGPRVTLAGHTFTGPYDLLADTVPGFGDLRVPKRFLFMTSMATASLAGVAVAGILRWIEVRTRGRLTNARVVCAAVVIAAAAWSVGRFMNGRPLALQPIETRATLPKAYRWLADAPPGAVLELPFRYWEIFPFTRKIEALRMYRSTYHWRPLVNGYSAYTPPTYRLLASMATRLPKPESIRDFARYAGVRYVVLDEQRMPKHRSTEWRKTDLPRHVFKGHAVYLLPSLPTDGPPPLGRPVEAWGDQTPGGVPLLPLTGDAQRARLSDPRLPAFLPPGRAYEISVVVENRSDRPWPGIVLPGSGALGLSCRVRDHAGRLVRGKPLVRMKPPPPQTPLGVDLQPGQRTRAPLWLWTPQQPGKYRIEVFLVQEGVGVFDPSLGGELTIPVEVRA